ncbi:MAG: tetratricopeptide repeat protein, partial [Planctomycetota bacterium]|nr:tetratricopeptide repeat protein [Planctomycetota bacterium]
DAYGHALQALRAAPNQAVAAPIAARAATSMLELGELPSDQRNYAITLIEDCADYFGRQPEILALLARAYAAIDRDADARAAVDELIASGGEVSAESIRALLDVARRENWPVEDAILALGAQRQNMTPALAFTLALEAARRGSVEEGVRILESRIEQASAADRFEYELRLATYLDAVDHGDALARLRNLADQYESNARAQLEVLNSKAGWRDEALIRSAIARLRTLAGESSSSWAIHEARRLLTFDPSEANAAQVEVLLAPRIQSDPTDVQARRLAAEARLLLDDRPRAIEYLSEALTADPGAVSIYPRLIALLQDAGAAQEAERRLRQFADAEGLSDSLRRRRAQLLSNQGLWNLAANDLTALLESGAGTAADRLALAQVRLKQGRVEDGERLLTQLLEDQNTSAAAIQTAADHYASTGRFQLALDTLDRLPNNPPGARDRAKAYLLERAGRIEQARALFAAHASESRTAEAWAELAQFHLRQNNLDAAASAVESGERAEGDKSLLKRAGFALTLARGEGLTPEARRELANLLTDEDPEGRALELSTIVADIQQRPGAAEDHAAALRRLLQNHPTFFPAWRTLVSVHLTAGRIALAENAAMESTRAMPADPRPYQMATEVLLRAGSLDRALATARQWRERSLDAPLDAEVIVAQIQEALGATDDALDTLAPRREAVIAVADERPERLVLLARLYAWNGEETAAHELLWPRAQQSAEWAERYLSVSAALVYQPAEARQWIENASEALDESARSSMLLAEAWYQLGLRSRDRADLQRSIDALAPTIASNQGGPEALALAAAVNEALGDRDEAERFYRLALERAPDSPFVLNNLAYLLLRTGGSADE